MIIGCNHFSVIGNQLLHIRVHTSELMYTCYECMKLCSQFGTEYPDVQWRRVIHVGQSLMTNTRVYELYNKAWSLIIDYLAIAGTTQVIHITKSI
jgi:hypothetical protein